MPEKVIFESVSHDSEISKMEKKYNNSDNEINVKWVMTANKYGISFRVMKMKLGSSRRGAVVNESD